MRLIDCGVNLTHASFDKDREQVLRDAEAAGVSPVIITGTNVEESGRAQRYAAACNTASVKKCFSTVGVHPHDAKTCDENTVAQLRALALRPEAVAIGECGLDYNRDFSPREVQRAWFEKQIELAAELDMPLFLHERDAFDDFYSILQNIKNIRKIKKAVHCFTGTGRELDAYLSLDCYIGITGWICDERRGVHLHPLVSRIPADRLLIETDAPYLAPRTLRENRRSGRNEPRYLVHIARYIADSIGKDPALLARETFRNACEFFDLPRDDHNEQYYFGAIREYPAGNIPQT
ncbi:MAG: TatD family hydrolase [Treponema sp.]|jgi:TatD DNase family protein|nr:TatD family hydrolase [Treponema sp.]